MADSTKLPFKTNAFDFTIEKGTIDALMCGEDTSIAEAILKEIFRVTKEKTFFITHGGPLKRKFLFKNIPIKEVSYFQQPLSDEADLINCMRALNKDKSLKEVMNDPKALLLAMMEFKKSSKNKKNFKIEEKYLDLTLKDILDDVAESGETKNKETEEKKDIEEVDKVYNPLRQNYCYIYIIQKY